MTIAIHEITLENYIALAEGTGLTNLSIDFKPMIEANIRRCLMVGRNGSGKSCLCNAISTPFPSQGDNRAHPIIPGRAGRKIIQYEKDGTLIRCDVRWAPSGTPSCFIFLDDSDTPIAETEKGNIKPYIGAVKELLGITPEYLRIGRIGGTIGGFLGLLPGQRKEYIGNFMPEMAEWSVMFTNASKRLTALKNAQGGLMTELGAIRPADELQSEKYRAELEAERLEREIGIAASRVSELDGRMAAEKPHMAALAAEAGLTSLDELTKLGEVMALTAGRAEKAAAELDALTEGRSVLVDIASNLDTTRARISGLRELIALKDGEKSGVTRERSAARARVDEIIAEANKVEATLRRISTSKTDIIQIEQLIADNEVRRASLAEELEGFPSEVPDGVDYNGARKMFDLLTWVSAELDSIRGRFPTFSITEELDGAASQEGIGRQIGKLQRKALENTEQREKLQLQAQSLLSQAQLARRFKGAHCSNKSCPFEAAVMAYATADDERSGKLELADALKESNLDIAERVKALEQVGAVVTEVEALSRRLVAMRAELTAAGVWDRVGSTAALIELLEAKGSMTDSVLSVSRLSRNLTLRRDLEECERILAELRAKVVSINEIADIRGTMEASLLTLRSDKTAAEERVTEVETRLAAVDAEITRQRAILGVIENIERAVKVRDSATAEVERLTVIHERAQDAIAAWVTMKEAAAEAREAEERLRKLMPTIGARVVSASHQLLRRQEFEERVAAGNRRLRVTSVIAEACHPAKGAPVEFLRGFLESTRTDVNALLDVAFGGDFRVDFVVNEKEFRIPVTKGSGRVIGDISEASDGQLALGKTVISLALIRQLLTGMGGYNLITLDEIDGPLDRERNRERFAAVMELLANELGVRQMFMVTHNDHFYAEAAAMVLLPGHALPAGDYGPESNKLVLADFSGG